MKPEKIMAWNIPISVDHWCDARSHPWYLCRPLKNCRQKENRISPIYGIMVIQWYSWIMILMILSNLLGSTILKQIINTHWLCTLTQWSHCKTAQLIIPYYYPHDGSWYFLSHHYPIITAFNDSTCYPIIFAKAHVLHGAKKYLPTELGHFWGKCRYPLVI